MSTITKVSSISGFLEWLPEVRLVEQKMLGAIQNTFERYGFCSLETPVVERLDVLLSKGGDTDKEMYRVERMSKDPQDSSDSKLGLHYDLTVPFARYVTQHAGELVYPFKRYQMQSVWRGERPQEGRYRQFVQCDIDVVNPHEIPLTFDAELPAIAYEALSEMSIGSFTFRLSNRKILQGFLEGLEVRETASVTRVLDKLDKLGPQKIREMLTESCALPESSADLCLALASIRTADSSFIEQVKALGVSSQRLEKGLEELDFVFTGAKETVAGDWVVDLSITRGFDYYTGSVYEVRWNDFPNLGSICAGGRYDNLTSQFSSQSMPGVGISIGFSRIFAKLVAAERLPIGPKGPTQVLVTWLDSSGSGKAREIAKALRARGVSVEVYHEPAKLQKQLRYASRKGIPFVWFDTDGSVKNMLSSEQVPADVSTWNPVIARATS